jgi:hypothetical protein
MSSDLNGLPGKWTREAGVNLRGGIFSLFTIIAGILAYGSLNGLVSIAGFLSYVPIHIGPSSDYYSHILLIPFVSAYFLFEERRRILEESYPELEKEDIFQALKYAAWLSFKKILSLPNRRLQSA